MMTPKKGPIKAKLDAAIERGRVGRAAKLTAKSEYASEVQSNNVKAAKLKGKANVVKEKINRAQNKPVGFIGKKLGRGLATEQQPNNPQLMRKSTSTPMNRPQTGELNFSTFEKNVKDNYIPKELKRTVKTIYKKQ